jgi:hypothetical protein
MEVSGQLHAPADSPPGKQQYALGPRAGLDGVAKRKIPAPAKNRTPVAQPVL